MFANAYFKEVWTSNATHLNIDLNWTVCEFLENITNSIRRHFNINNCDFEVVTVPQITSAGCFSEDADALTPCNVLLKHALHIIHNISGVSFYIRRKNYDYSHARLGLLPFIEENINACVVCLDNMNTTTYFGCIHTICSTCTQGCLTVNHNRCPVCRQNLRF
jgi:hypothetical protein